MSASVYHLNDDLSQFKQVAVSIDQYHGVMVEDKYRWLEEAEDPAVKIWTEHQNLKTRLHLDALSDRAEVEKQLNQLFDRVGPSYSGLISCNGWFF